MNEPNGPYFVEGRETWPDPIHCKRWLVAIAADWNAAQGLLGILNYECDVLFHKKFRLCAYSFEHCYEFVTRRDKNLTAKSCFSRISYSIEPDPDSIYCGDASLTRATGDEFNNPQHVTERAQNHSRKENIAMSAVVKIVEGAVTVSFRGEHRTVSTEYSQVKGALRNAVKAAAESLKADLAARGFSDRVEITDCQFDGEIMDPCANAALIAPADEDTAESFSTDD